MRYSTRSKSIAGSKVVDSLCIEGTFGAHPVLLGSVRTNGEHLRMVFDMHGNVQGWVCDSSRRTIRASACSRAASS